MTKLTNDQQREQFRAINDEFVNIAEANYGYAYTTGYFSSTINEMFELLSKRDKEYMILNMQRAALRQQQYAAEIAAKKQFALAD